MTQQLIINIVYYILLILIAFVDWLVFRDIAKKNKEKKQLEQKLLDLKNEIIASENEIKILGEKIAKTCALKDVKQKELVSLSASYTNKQESLEALKKEYSYELEKLNKFKKSLEDTYDRESEKLSKDLDKNRKEYADKYLECMKTLTESWNEAFDDNQKAYEAAKQALYEEEQKVSAAVEARKRAQLIEQDQDYYKINISDQDKIEIKQLKQVCCILRAPEAINKVIYKTYYEKPLNDMIGRVIGNKVVTGIYKITNIENGKCYVGQAVDVSSRFKQHVKRGLGAETATKNKLYPIMATVGVENFTFELIEECKRDELNAREDYWQDYFHAKDYGYSIK